MLNSASGRIASDHADPNHADHEQPDQQDTDQDQGPSQHRVNELVRTVGCVIDRTLGRLAQLTKDGAETLRLRVI